MGRSIVQDDEQSCYFCGRVGWLEKHHIFAGVANRRISENENFFVMICHDCHTGKKGAQYDKDRSLMLKQEAQRAYERSHTRAEWMALIRKNYLEE